MKLFQFFRKLFGLAKVNSWTLKHENIPKGQAKIHEEVSDNATGILKTVPIEKLRGVIAKWIEVTDTLHIIFYFDGELSEMEIEEASVASTEILASLPIAYLNEEYLRMDYPQPLPEGKFWVFRREE